MTSCTALWDGRVSCFGPPVQSALWALASALLLGVQIQATSYNHCKLAGSFGSSSRQRSTTEVNILSGYCGITNVYIFLLLFFNKIFGCHISIIICSIFQSLSQSYIDHESHRVPGRSYLGCGGQKTWGCLDPARTYTGFVTCICPGHVELATISSRG